MLFRGFVVTNRRGGMSFANSKVRFMQVLPPVAWRWLAIGVWDKVRCSTERVLILELWAGAQFPPAPDEKRLVRFVTDRRIIRGGNNLSSSPSSPKYLATIFGGDL